MLSLNQINALIPKSLRNSYNLDTDEKFAAFLANCDWESRGFSKFIESTNYTTVDRLLAVFPKYFALEATGSKLKASKYINSPSGLANVVYANRMGNGDTNSGDGFKYRGRGAIQLTGKTNYALCGRDTGLDLVNNPDLLLDSRNAILSALWFWRSKRIDLVNPNDLSAIRRLVNGNPNDAVMTVKSLYQKYVKVLKGE
jgi:putative chitinase